MAPADPFRCYKDLPPLTDIRAVGAAEGFMPLADEWCLFITDIRGSTAAIRDGHYKDVNTLGAASIAAAANVLGHSDFPFVFGGDGASLAVPLALRDQVGSALLGVAQLAQQQFAMDLRVGMVPVAEIAARGAAVHIARYEITHGRCVALFRGGGLSLAEDLIKHDQAFCYQHDQANSPANLAGLSCRWDKIPSAHGCVISLLMLARPREANQHYRDFFNFLDSIINGGVAAANPVNPDLMRYRSLRDIRKDEVRFQPRRSSWRWFSRWLEIIAAVLIFRRGWHPLFLSPQHYRDSMRIHADYCKFDDMLRLVIDCSPDQAQAIREYLQQSYIRRECYFGLHQSSSSLMTCFVHGLKDGEHLHFIDGNNGGYAAAARELKAQFADSHSHRQRAATTTMRSTINHA